MAVDPAHVRPTNADDGMFYGRTGHIFSRFHGLLNGRNRFFQIHDHAFARTARFRNSVPAITQATVGHLCHERARFGAAYIDRR